MFPIAPAEDSALVELRIGAEPVLKMDVTLKLVHAGKRTREQAGGAESNATAILDVAAGEAWHGQGPSHGVLDPSKTVAFHIDWVDVIKLFDCSPALDTEFAGA